MLATMSIAQDFNKLVKNCIDLVNTLSKQDKSLWFHGTNSESAECIMKEGFKCLLELENRFNLGKGLRGEKDLIWFTKEPTEACDHILYYPRGAKHKDFGKIVLAKLKVKKPFILNEKVPKEAYEKAVELNKKGDPRFFRVSYAINDNMSGEQFLNSLSLTDVEENGKVRNPTYGELIKILGYDSVMYKSGKGGKGWTVFNRENIKDAIAVEDKNLIEIEGLLWNFG